MRTEQNSACRKTIPKLGIGRGVSLARHGERSIENPRLRSKLSCKDSSWLQISNREPMAIFRRAFSLFSGFEPQASSLQNLIANLELELHLTGCKTNHMQFSNRKFSAIFHCIPPVPLSNLLVTRHSLAQNRLGACEGSLITALLIETPRLKIRISRPISTTSNFLIETKCGFCIPKSAGLRVSALPYLLASLCPNLRVSVPRRPIFAIMAGSN